MVAGFEEHHVTGGNATAIALGARPDPREGVGTRARPRVLIVDEDEQILRGLVRALKQDHDVLLATSPAVALAMAETHAPRCGRHRLRPGRR